MRVAKPQEDTDDVFTDPNPSYELRSPPHGPGERDRGIGSFFACDGPPIVFHAALAALRGGT